MVFKCSNKWQQTLLFVTVALSVCVSRVIASAQVAPTNPSECPSGYNVIEGTGGKDTIFATSGPDCILGYNGKDTIFGLSGDDLIAGGEGNDIISGGPGDDEIYGEEGNDLIVGDDGDDLLFGGPGNDGISGGNGRDGVYGGSGNDLLAGGADDDAIDGGDGNDDVFGGSGNDLIDGGSGNDNMYGGDGDDQCANQGAGSNNQCESTTLFALISGVETMMHRGDKIVHWRTESEIQSLGFRVYREDSTRSRILVTPELVPALHTAPAGGDYYAIDRSSNQGNARTYWVEEIDIHGVASMHGPFIAHNGSTVPEGLALQDGFVSQARSLGQTRGMASTSAERLSTFQRQDVETAEALRLQIQQDALYRVDAQTIANLFATSYDNIRQRIAEGDISVSLAGKQVSWFSNDNIDALYFWGKASTSNYSRSNTYWLRLQSGQRLIASPQEPSELSAQEILHTEHLEQDLFPGVVVAKDPEADYWFWKVISGLSASTKTASLYFNAHDLVASATANIVFDLQAASSDPTPLEAWVNGNYIGSFEVSNTSEQTFSVSISQQLLHEGQNKIDLRTVSSQQNAGVCYVNSATVQYRKNAIFNSGASFKVIEDSNLSLQLPADRQFMVIAEEAENQFSLIALEDESFVAEQQTQYHLVSMDEAIAPYSVEADRQSQLRDERNKADYLIITHSSLIDAAHQLRDYRSSKGLRSMIVDISDIYDEFGYGHPTPEAVRSFLRYTTESWSQAPRYVVLAGAGNFDYHNRWGYGNNLIPPMMASTAHGLFSSDVRFSDFDDNGSPEMAMGRLPAKNSEQLSSMIDRVIRYESTQGPWMDRVVLVADTPAAEGDFSAAIAELASQIPDSVQHEKVDFATTSYGIAKQQVLDTFHQGALMLSYVGHSGIDRLGSAGILTTADIDNMDNLDNLPILTGMTCVMSRFAVPGVTSLAEKAVSASNGGAIATVGASGLVRYADAKDFGRMFTRQSFQGAHHTLGDAVVATFSDATAQGMQAEALRVFTLMGDPALALPPSEALSNGEQNSTEQQHSHSTLTEQDEMEHDMVIAHAAAQGVSAEELDLATAEAAGCSVSQGQSGSSAAWLVLFVVGFALMRRRSRA